MKRLWEVEHAYYCNEGNYYASGRDSPSASYKTWASFKEAEGEADMDMNLVFRWDWREGEGWGAGEYAGDDYYRNGKLLVFFMGQRKGLYRWAEIEVCRADEPAVRAYLEPRYRYLMELWAPFASVDTRPEDEDPAQTGASLASGAVPAEEQAGAQGQQP